GDKDAEQSKRARQSETAIEPRKQSVDTLLKIPVELDLNGCPCSGRAANGAGKTVVEIAEARVGGAAVVHLDSQGIEIRARSSDGGRDGCPGCLLHPGAVDPPIRRFKFVCRVVQGRVQNSFQHLKTDLV